MAAQQERKLPFGKIEPNTAKYFWSCALGGVVGKSSHVCACVWSEESRKLTGGKHVVGVHLANKPSTNPTFLIR